MTCAIQIPCEPSSLLGGTCWYYPPENCSYSCNSFVCVPSEVMSADTFTFIMILVLIFCIVVVYLGVRLWLK